MRSSLALVLPFVLYAGCGSSGSSPNDAGNTGTGGTSSTGTGGSSSTGTGGRSSSGTGGSSSTGTGGSSTTGTGGSLPGMAGNPNGSCTAGVPTSGQPADVSNPTSVIGTGTAASCTFSALNTAVGKGGVITFNCGSAPVTIAITATMNLPTNKNTVIDGGGKITLDGGHAVQILSFNGPDFQTNNNGLTLQHLSFVNEIGRAHV
jgi:hypothetical protein